MRPSTDHEGARPSAALVRAEGQFAGPSMLVAVQANPDVEAVNHVHHAESLRHRRRRRRRCMLGKPRPAASPI